jgi:hypothetical protein
VRQPRIRGASKCAEEDSNLHPVSLDQALNLVTRVSDMSRSCASVQNERGSGRNGRNGRSGCCRGCCHDRSRCSRRETSAPPPLTHCDSERMVCDDAHLSSLAVVSRTR